MKQIAFALALLLSSSGAWAAEKLSLVDISQYLNGITTADSTFTQVNDDGSLSTGTLYIHRPNRMRFEYDPPDSTLVVASAGAVVIHDKKSNQPPESYPLKRTPLSLILTRNVDLGQANMVVDHGFDGTSTIVTAQDPKNPEYGFIELVFTDSPVELRKWVVHDSVGSQTTVLLGALKTGTKLRDDMFDPNAIDQNR
jgi:outer membrane lipoprotein-sorting protein